MPTKKNTSCSSKTPPVAGRFVKAGLIVLLGTYRTQGDAIASAKKISQNQGTRVVVHGRDGRIKKR